jgi:hypothetical protein
MTTFKEIRGTDILALSSDPSNPETGQIWYNSSSGTLKGYKFVGTWASGNNLGTARLAPGGFGTQTAAIAFGGQPATTTPTSLSESWNGTSWTATPALNTGRLYLATGAGIQTAGLGFGGQTVPGSADSSASESYNGSTWTSTPSLNSARRNAGGSGTQTAALAFGGNGPGPLSSTEIWNSTSWTNSPATLNTAREGIAGIGTQTAALSVGGGGTAVESYNGSTWTTISSLTSSRDSAGRAGTQTAALVFGGNPVSSVTESWNGTSWSTNPTSLATNRGYMGSAGTQNLALAAGGSPRSNATELYTGLKIQTITVS